MAVAISAIRAGDNYLLNGHKVFVDNVMWVACTESSCALVLEPREILVSLSLFRSPLQTVVLQLHPHRRLATGQTGRYVR
jgi:hypothetical protein